MPLNTAAAQAEFRKVVLEIWPSEIACPRLRLHEEITRAHNWNVSICVARRILREEQIKLVREQRKNVLRLMHCADRGAGAEAQACRWHPLPAAA